MVMSIILLQSPEPWNASYISSRTSWYFLKYLKNECCTCLLPEWYSRNNIYEFVKLWNYSVANWQKLLWTTGNLALLSVIEPRLVVNNQSKAFALGYVYWRKTYFKLITLFIDYHCQSYILFLAREVCSVAYYGKACPHLTKGFMH